MATSKKFLVLTFVQGWWGLIAFFANFFAVGTDVFAYFRYRALPEPRESPRTVGRPQSMSARQRISVEGGSSAQPLASSG